MTKRKGRPRLACNDWAAQQIAEGRTIQEIRGEYIRRHRTETGYYAIDVDRSIRSAIARRQPGSNGHQDL